MSFISDLLVEISSFRIRIGNKLNALKTLIDGKANIDGSNIPYDTKWSHLKAGGLGDYYYTDTGLGSNFTRVMVWDQGGWFWTNKSGMQTWLGLDDKVDIADQLDYYQYFQAGLTSSGLLFKQMDGSDFSAASSTGRLYDVKLTTRATGSQTGARYVLFNDGSGWQVEELTPPSSSGFTARLRINSNGLPELYNNQSNTAYGAHVNVTRYRTDSGKGGEWKRLLSINYEHLFNTPALTDNNYLESIITTNGTTAGTVYAFKRVGLSDLTLQLTAASASFSGVVTTGAQTFEGPKEFLKSPIVPNAINADEAVNKSQLDAVAGSLGNYLPLAGGTMTGKIILASNANAIIEKTTPNGTLSNIIHSISTSASGGGRAPIRYSNPLGMDKGLGFSGNGDLVVGDWSSIGTLSTSWDIIWHEGHFNPSQYVLQSSLNTQLSNYVPTSRTITINGTTLDLSADRSWNIPDTNTTYTSSNGILLTGTNFTPTYGTSANTIAQGNDARINNGQTAFGWGDHDGLYLEKQSLPINPAAAWDTIGENRIVHSTSGANSPYTGYGIGMNFQGTSDNYRSQLFFNTNINSGSIQYRVANNNGWTSVRFLWDNNNFNPAQYVMISALNATLANYGTLAGTQTWTGQNTYTQALIVPNGTLNGHAEIGRASCRERV